MMRKIKVNETNTIELKFLEVAGNTRIVGSEDFLLGVFPKEMSHALLNLSESIVKLYILKLITKNVLEIESNSDPRF